jgi:hypothetical protein
MTETLLLEYALEGKAWPPTPLMSFAEQHVRGFVNEATTNILYHDDTDEHDDHEHEEDQV